MLLDCESCGRRLKPADKFCPNCGGRGPGNTSYISPSSRVFARDLQPAPKRDPYKIVFIVGMGLVFSMAVALIWATRNAAAEAAGVGGDYQRPHVELPNPDSRVVLRDHDYDPSPTYHDVSPSTYAPQPTYGPAYTQRQQTTNDLVARSSAGLQWQWLPDQDGSSYVRIINRESFALQDVQITVQGISPDGSTYIWKGPDDSAPWYIDANESKTIEVPFTMHSVTRMFGDAIFANRRISCSIDQAVAYR